MKNYKFFSLLLILILLFSFSSCKDDVKYKKSIFALDTIIELTIYGDKANDAFLTAEAKIRELEAKFSVTNKNSEISKINAKSGQSVKVSSDTLSLLKTAINVSKLTDGAFDPTIYPLVKAWGFTTNNNTVPNKDTISDLLKNVDYTKIELCDDSVKIPKGYAIDLGGIAKGYISSELCRVLRESGVTSAIVSLGGNIQTVGNKPDGSGFSVAVTDPNDEDNYVGVINDSPKAVITSGNYQRFFTQNGVKYHHIIDTNTGYPAQNNLTSVTVVADDGAYADALSTGLFSLGYEKAMELYKEGLFEAIFITNDKRVITTNGLKDRFIPNYDNKEYVYE